MKDKRRLIGHVEKRGRNSYRLTVTDGKNHKGEKNRHRKTIRAGNDKQVAKELAKFIAEIEGGSFIDPGKVTLSGLVEKWLKEHAKPNLSPKTNERYESLYKGRIKKALGHFKLNALRPLHFVEFYNSLGKEGARLDDKAGGLSQNTIHHYHRLLSSVFNTAVIWGILKENPEKNVAPKRGGKGQEKRACTANEASRLIEALEGEELKYKVLIHIALATGLRRGEIMGLEWQDINMEDGTLRVVRTSQYVNKVGVVTKAPKTDESARTIAIPGYLIEMLREYRKEWLEHRLKVGDLWEGSERLFITELGSPLHPQTPSQWFRKFILKEGLPYIPFHGLRHTAATTLISSGIDIATISSRLGHSRKSTTLDIYVHSSSELDKKAADVIGEILNPQKVTK